MQTDRAAIDHIQYPAQTLGGKTGDCDDLTVLYCALLESAGMATARGAWVWSPRQKLHYPQKSETSPPRSIILSKASKFNIKCRG